jgi:hypothetical protein
MIVTAFRKYIKWSVPVVRSGRNCVKYKLGVSAIMIALSIAAAAHAADISGKWYVPMEGVYVEMDFEVDGTVLKGTMYNPQSGTAKIKDGKIDGDNISFYVERKFASRDMRVVWQGLVSGDEIEFNRVIGGGRGLRLIAKRQKEGLPEGKNLPATKKKGRLEI